MEKKRLHSIIAFFAILLLGLALIPSTLQAEETEALKGKLHQKRTASLAKYELPETIKRFEVFDSGLNFAYPDAVRGIYLTGHSAGGSRFEKLVNFVDTTELNAMVIDIKDDHGYITFKLDEGHPFEEMGRNFIKDPREVLEVLEDKGIYPIARIVVFKDTELAKNRPDLSFTENGKVWANGKGDSFVSPFQKEVWEYNVEVAKIAAELGFKEIQFDYVRFPEGFEKRDKELQYDQGEYKDSELNDVKKRVEAVTDFVAYARDELEEYGVDVSVDIFGYAATIEETPGIGQNFTKISENVDVISSMIYPSHWTPYFGIDNPDEKPYELVNEYAKVENEVLGKLETPPTSRPWLQDFEAPWLYSGPAKQYGVAEVEAQIKALNENGINEFLLWNAGNTYTEGVDYTP
ncbi:putative glycoside hydrolase [Aquibacillus koreensis]|uniref:Glycoside hydrolase n=1 Tax=Aquibacillus koreensis TaxID=279446 RepID=A0A9X3WML3_9BACI|nr:putative glycoside hydrolase [Aquibacillus koreensis]MCT2535654.1 putative glycoside hydrolase [Aquibacillus koreensis]MDC3420061.1 putative glycoside hydrolase [Aquibacillus koreensis]